MSDLVVNNIIKIVLVVLLIVVVLIGIGTQIKGPIQDFFKNLPGDKEITPPLSCEEYCSFKCNEDDCNKINEQWKEYYKKKGLPEKDVCRFNNGICSTLQ